jgi:monoterpene epsilon-lactone hydrolase
VPSSEHEAMVRELAAAGPRLRAEPLTPDEMAVSRTLERDAEVPPVPADVLLDETELGGVPCLSLSPLSGATEMTVVYFHGGGYVFTTARAKLAPVIGLVRATGARFLSVDYRRAPEDPYPAPVEDAAAVYRALLADGTAPSQVAFAGESAGGGLVLCAMIALRDAGVPLPAAGVAVSPWTDLAVTGASADTVDDPVVDGAGLRMMAQMYLAGADPMTPLASPLYADLHGLPPLLVQVGTREALLDDARRVADRARAAGVDVTLAEYPDVVHMWIVFGPELPESHQAFEQAADFLRRHLRPGG